ncbi:iron-containing redox enzyme family protein [Sorangium cellulosum]|jgi:hypothetical protein|uniref:Iron-containing redox enzyme family protein n=2 Tax=Sorangium cellulosum TaxID=56 RepID=S4XQ60_SORCE|nr:iron-containing redox enzyme family protein [Sorangium cellulosum]AGP34644.1 hypothetical protein SCE1572_09060 [Sorangium cellulosum So0157-2]
MEDMSQGVRSAADGESHGTVAGFLSHDWGTVSAPEFWKLADDFQAATLRHAEKLFSCTETASLSQLRSILIQYRYFTVYYIADLAVLVARVSDGPLRSFLGTILSDELGMGDPEKAHPRLYDKFLQSIGVSDDVLPALGLKKNVNILDSVRLKLMSPSYSAEYGIGLRGMGGECVCQVYLAQLYEHFSKNPLIQERKNEIDWKFWELHVGDHDIEHRIQTRDLINKELVLRSPKALRDLSLGYRESMKGWIEFWDNIFSCAQGDQLGIERIGTSSVASFAPPAN